MYIYLTSGTPEFMESLCAKYAKENMIAMHGSTNSVLLHETEGKSFFSTPRKFEVIDSLGQFEDSGFFVFNNIPIIDEGRPVFEHRVLNRSSNLDKEPGFISFSAFLASKNPLMILKGSVRFFSDLYRLSLPQEIP